MLVERQLDGLAGQHHVEFRLFALDGEVLAAQERAIDQLDLAVLVADGNAGGRHQVDAEHLGQRDGDLLAGLFEDNLLVGDLDQVALEGIALEGPQLAGARDRHAHNQDQQGSAEKHAQPLVRSGR